MITKKTMSIVTLVVIGGIGLFILIIYATVKTKTTSLHNYEPFKELVGKTVKMNNETVLFKETLKSNKSSEYPYTLLDSLHPQWQYAQDQLAIAEPDMEKIATFPAGTSLSFTKAIQYTNGVSGFSYPTLLGTLTVNGITYEVGYQWGTISMEKSYAKIEKCWQFHQAPWQDVADTAFYALPVAKFW